MGKIKVAILILMSFVAGLIVCVGLFYNENWNGIRRHLEWDTALRDWNPGGDSSLRQCLYYVVPTGEWSGVMKEIFCVKVKWDR